MYKLLIFFAVILACLCVNYLVQAILRSRKVISESRFDRRTKAIPLCVAKYSFLLLMILAIVYPFIYAFFMSFKTGEDVFSLSIFPKKYVMDNYVFVLTDDYINLVGSFLNSMVYAVIPSAVGVLSSAMGAYALSRLDFKGRDKIFIVLFSTTCIPGVITLIPSFIMHSRFYNWVGTPMPLIIPGLFGGVGCIFFLRQAFFGLPKQLDEAGVLDGLSKFGVFFRICLPLAKAAILAQFLLTFNASYNNFMGPLMYVGTQRELYTVQLTIYTLNAALDVNIEHVMAACLVALVPSIVLFGFAQKYFLGSGMSADGLKG